MTDDDSAAVARTFKVLVLGETGVGKSSLIRYYHDGVPQPNMLSTIGIDYSDTIVSVRGIKVKLRVWDTAGQERFQTFTTQFFRGTNGVLLLYDITSLDSFYKLKKWMKLLNDSGLTNLDVVIVGNKCDLDHMRIVPHDLPEALAYELSYTHILTSSINGTNVKKVFYKIAESLIHSYNIFIPGIEAEAVFNGALSQSEDANTRSIILSRQEYIETSERIKKQKKSCCTKH